jgi:hypothetical protein
LGRHALGILYVCLANSNLAMWIDNRDAKDSICLPNRPEAAWWGLLVPMATMVAQGIYESLFDK